MALTPFAKGKSGNPGGRPKLPEELKEAFKALAPKAVETLASIMSNDNAKDSDRVRAAEVILDRGYGKPKQQTELTGEDGNAIEIVKRIIVNGS